MAPLGRNFFGATILGPVETNIGGSGHGIVWPIWNPTSFRAVDNFGGVPPTFNYLQGISLWGAVETSLNVFDWTLFDPAWTKLISNGVTEVLFSLQNVPQWAQVGNAYSFPNAAISAATPCVVSAPGNQYQNGWRVFFTGGSLPTGLVLGNSTNPNTSYYVVSNGVDGAGKFRLSLTSGGAAINTSGSAGTSTVTAYDTPPANMSTLAAWVTAYLTRATLNGLSIKFIENLNEPNNGPGFYVGSIAELVTMQQTIYTAAKQYDPSIQVCCPPINTIAAFGTNYLNSFLAAGGGSWCDIIAFHGYPSDGATASQTLYSTQLGSLFALLASNGQGQKPVWNTEYSALTGVASTDEIWLAATTFIDWNAGISRKYFYAYDAASDLLWIGPNISPPAGALNVAGVAYQQLIGWLSGASIKVPLALNGVVWSMDILQGNGAYGRVVWTSDGSTPNYNVPSWAVSTLALDGSSSSNPGQAISIGALPKLLSDSPSTAITALSPASAPSDSHAGIVSTARHLGVKDPKYRPYSEKRDELNSVLLSAGVPET